MAPELAESARKRIETLLGSHYAAHAEVVEAIVLFAVECGGMSEEEAKEQSCQLAYQLGGVAQSVLKLRNLLPFLEAHRIAMALLSAGDGEFRPGRYQEGQLQAARELVYPTAWDRLNED